MSSDSPNQVPRNSHLVVVALGSNLGSTVETVLKGAARLREKLHVPVQLSSLWSSEPVDCPPGSPPFINAVLTFLAPEDLAPESLLAELKTIEREFGRVPKVTMNEPRVLDLDLIAFGNIILQTPELTIPHPRAHLRRFVLAPLAELAPELRLPGRSESVAELLDLLPPGPNISQIRVP